MKPFDIRNSLEKAIESATYVEKDSALNEVRYMLVFGFFRYYLVMTHTYRDIVRCEMKTDPSDRTRPICSFDFVKDAKSPTPKFETVLMTLAFDYNRSIDLDTEKNAIDVCNTILRSKNMYGAIKWILSHMDHGDRAQKAKSASESLGEQIAKDTQLLLENLDLLRETVGCIYHMYALCGGVISLDFIENRLGENRLSTTSSEKITNAIKALKDRAVELNPELLTIAPTITSIDASDLRTTANQFPLKMIKFALYDTMPDVSNNPIKFMSTVIAEELVAGLKTLPNRRSAKGATLYFLKNFVDLPLDITEGDMK
jgi:hypothetical protein